MQSWARRWNEASLKQLANLQGRSQSNPWSLMGMFGAGLVLGAIGACAVTQRSQINRLVWRARLASDRVLDEFGGVEVTKTSASAKGSNHLNDRRKAEVEAS